MNSIQTICVTMDIENKCYGFDIIVTFNVFIFLEEVEGKLEIEFTKKWVPKSYWGISLNSAKNELLTP